MDVQKLITKEFLAAFGDKCKKLLKPNPQISTTTDSTGRWICIDTKLGWNNYGDNGFNELYLNVQGVIDGSNEVKKVLNSNFYLSTNSAGALVQAYGLNIGQQPIESAVFMRGEQDNLRICLRLPQNRWIDKSLVDVIACLDDVQLYDLVDKVEHLYDEDVEQPELETDYEQIATSPSLLPFDKLSTIGSISSQLTEETYFVIVEDQTDGPDPVILESRSYPEEYIFSKIFESTQSEKLSHGLTFQYDWANPIGQSDSPVSVTNGNLDRGTVVKIPVPDLLSGGATSSTWVNKVKVTNGLVTEVDTDTSVSPATINTIGGVRLGSDVSVAFGDKIWVQLDANNKAFIDSALVGVDKHRDDLSRGDYQTLKPNYYNQIWQHIGPNRDGFINGYFYKCVKRSYQVTYDSSNTPYLVGSQIGTKLDNYIIDNGLSFSTQLPFLLYVDQADYPETTGSGSAEHDTEIQELDTFKLTNLNLIGEPTGDVLTLTKAQLVEVLDIQLKTTDGWDTALVKNVPISNMQLEFRLSGGVFAWRQWNVQPTSGGSGEFDYITNTEIDYLFETHVTGITLDNDTLTCEVGDVVQLIATITPPDASVQTLDWSTSDNTVAVVTADGEVHCIGEGSCTITCRSVSEPDIYAECEVTVSEISTNQ